MLIDALCAVLVAVIWGERACRRPGEVTVVIDIEQPGRVPPLADPEVRRLRAIGIPAAAEWLRRHSEGAWDWGGEA
jgi:hypothetical protein